MFQYIETKSILSKLRNRDDYFGITYNMNLYRGCQHGCIYCDTRSECYQINDISTISVKKNALELLEKELSSKRIKATIGTGSMNDPYMPIEKELQLTRNALKIINSKRFPVHVITKGDMVVRDYDILQSISSVYAATSFTITTADDKQSKLIEPNAPKTSDRFKAMEFLAKKGIYTGVTLMPLLPFINDTKENVKQILQMAKDAGASYVAPMFGVTLRKGSRDYFYHALDRNFPQIKEKYQTHFGEQYECMSLNYRELREVYKTQTQLLNLKTKMNFYKPEEHKQLSIF